MDPQPGFRPLRSASSSPALFKSTSTGSGSSRSSCFGSARVGSLCSSFDDKFFRHGMKMKGAISSGRLWSISQGIIIALLLLAFSSLLFVGLFGPRLALVREPLVLRHRGRERLVVRLRSASGLPDPLSDLDHAHNAGRKELLRIFDGR